jgi:hypothetical protein
MLADRLSRMIATLHDADATPLASCTLAEEIISRTTAKNSSRSGVRKPLSIRATSPVPTITHFVSDEGESENNRPDPPVSTSHSAPRLTGTQLSYDEPAPLPASAPPFTTSVEAIASATLLFNGVDPNRGYGGQPIKFYGVMFSPTADYYAKFGQLEPTSLIYRNAGLLEGEVPECDETGPVSVSIVTKDGYTMCAEMRRFVYLDRDLKNA